MLFFKLTLDKFNNGKCILQNYCARQVQEGKHHLQMIGFLIDRGSSCVLHSQANDSIYLTCIYAAVQWKKNVIFFIGSGHVCIINVGAMVSGNNIHSGHIAKSVSMAGTCNLPAENVT